MHLQWPLKRGQKKKAMSASIEQQTKIEAGFTEIKGTHFLMKRIEFTDDFFDTMCSVLREQVKILLEKKGRSPQDEELLKKRTMQLMNLEAYRQLKKSGMAWSTSKEDNDMSERYSALEKVFARNWDNPVYQKLLLASLWYLGDISFGEKHVEPAPTLLVQQPTASQRIDVSGLGHAKKEES